MMFRDSKTSIRRASARVVRASKSRKLMDALESRLLLSDTVIGNVESADAGTITGWAYDSQAPNTAVQIIFQLDGTNYSPISANVNRPDLTNLPNNTNNDLNHGFSSSTPTNLAGTHTLNVIAINPDTNEQTVLGTKTFTNHAPTGAIQSSSNTSISGYAYDPDVASTSIEVLLEIDGNIVANQTANISQPALTSTIGSPNHGFNMLFSALSPGTHSIQVFGVDPQTGVSTLINSPSAPGSAKLAFNVQPTIAVTGAVIAPAITVDVQDSGGTLVSADTSVVTLSIASGPAGGVLGGTATATASGGEATFNNITFSKAGTYTLVATDGLLTSATSTSFTITAPVVAPAPDPKSVKLLVKAQPKKGTAEAALAPFTVDVLNAKGKLVLTDESAVKLTILSGPAGGTIVGTSTVAAVNGIATFGGLSLTPGGKYVLLATDASLVAGKSKPIVVAPLPPVALHFVTQPITVAANGAMATPVTISLVNKHGAVVTSAHSTVKVALVSGPVGAKLKGNSASVKGGIATFSKLRLSLAGTYVLSFSDGR